MCDASRKLQHCNGNVHSIELVFKCQKTEKLKTKNEISELKRFFFDFNEITVICFIRIGFFVSNLLTETDQKRQDSKTIDASSERRSIRRVIILMPIIVVASCLFPLVEPRLGVLVWVVFPLVGRMVKKRQAET